MMPPQSVVTGGSPNITRLPNQLRATLKAMEDVTKSNFSKLSSEDKSYFDAIRSGSEGQRRKNRLPTKLKVTPQNKKHRLFNGKRPRINFIY
jgi:hypothetical protein